MYEACTMKASLARVYSRKYSEQVLDLLGMSARLYLHQPHTDEVLYF